MILALNHLQLLNGNKLKKMKRFFVFYVALFLSKILFSQVEIPISNEKEFYNGKFYYVHEVQIGHTVYSIAKAYSVTVEDVYTANPFSRDGIKLGQFLRIPIMQDEIETQNIDTLPPIKKESLHDVIFLLQYYVEETTTIKEIAKKYNLEKSELIAYNQNYAKKDKVHKQSIIYVPIKDNDIITEQLLMIPKVQGLLLEKYFVIKSETLFSISRKFGCSVSELQKFNPNMSMSLRENEVIWVPSLQNKSEIVQKVENQTKCEPLQKQAVYNVALLIPLYLSEVENISISSKSSSNRAQFKSFSHLQFYEGFLLALEKINFQNTRINLNVYDVANDPSQITALIQKGLLDVDLIIGPFFQSSLEALLPYAQRKNIPIIDMLTSSNLDLSNNHSDLFSTYPGVTVQLENLLSHLQSIHSNKKIIVIYQNNQNETSLVENLKLINNKYPDLNINYLDYSANGYSGLKSVLERNTENIVVSFSTREAFLNSFLRSLYNDFSKSSITLFGMLTWLRFESIDLKYLNHFNTHFYSSQFVDYESDNVLEFVGAFQEDYYTDPNRTAFLGYDVALFFLTALSTYGENFSQCINEVKVDLLSTGFNFKKQANSNHFQNHYVLVYDMVDFVLKDAKRAKK